MGRIITNQDALSEILKGLFYDYIERKRTRQLYKEGPEGLIIPKRLLIFYFQQPEENRHLNNATDNFLRHYIACESILENAHLKFEKAGLKEMYEYLLSDEINYMFDIYTLLELHKKLFSKAPYPEAGGVIRNGDAHLDGVPVDLTPAFNIRYELKMLDYDLKDILDMQKQVKENPAHLFDYIDKCIRLKCNLIKVHPFSDGNGRTIRAFINKLFMDVNLPPIYISSNENKTYKKAMQKAIGEENDYTSIINFYYFKICDSIIELENDYTYGQKQKSSPKTVIDLATRIKNQLPAMTNHYSLDEEIASLIKDYLDEQDITSQILNVAFFEPSLEPHAFVVASYQSGSNKTKKLLIDPLFEMYVNENNVKHKKTTEAMFENLKDNGVTFVNQNDIYKYILIFYDAYIDAWANQQTFQNSDVKHTC